MAIFYHYHKLFRQLNQANRFKDSFKNVSTCALESVSSRIKGKFSGRPPTYTPVLLPMIFPVVQGLVFSPEINSKSLDIYTFRVYTFQNQKLHYFLGALSI